MLFSEQLREVWDEEVLYTGGDTGWSGSYHDWTTRLTKAITLTKEKIVYLRADTRVSNCTGAGRVTLDDVPILSSGGIHGYETVKREVFILLSAGTHTFRFQTSMWSAGTGGKIKIESIHIAALNFPDKDSEAYDSGNVAAANGAQTTILSEQTFTIPAVRKLAVGEIKAVTCIVTVYMETVDLRKNYPKNVGEGNAAGAVSWKVYLDGAQTDWDYQATDTVVGYDQNLTYGEGAFGRLVKVLEPGAAYRLRLDAYNDTGSEQNCRAVVSIIMCPWIIPDEEYNPVALDFPQGSTLYVFLEPLNDNPTKYVKIGKQRFVSFGEAMDYYASQSGTDILEFSYTFEVVEVEKSTAMLRISGYGGCVSILGVDVR